VSYYGGTAAEADAFVNSEAVGMLATVPHDQPWSTVYHYRRPNWVDGESHGAKFGRMVANALR